jgi:signal transduction histidine kinase
MKKQIERFDRTVLDLLELSRLDAQAEESEKEIVRLNDLIVRIMNRYGFGNIEYRSSVASSDGETAGEDECLLDRRRIERVLVNLLENARDHAGGANRVSLVLNNETFVISVHDSGPGIAASERNNIFNRFARGTASRNSTGSGLGLAIVQEHARSMNGAVTVESSPEGGAVFSFTFPKIGPVS